MREIVMGNNRSTARGFPLHPPRDLNSLLTEIESSEDVKKSVWIKRFREHLTKLERFDLEAALEFVIISHLMENNNRVGNKPHNRRPTVPMSCEDRRHLLKKIGINFFSEDAASPIPLSNQILREDLCSVLADLDKKDDSILEEAARLVRMARNDYKVWKGGLDSAYNKFLSLKPSPHPFTAVLLSIL